jgi:hypothetical protein
MVATDAPIQLEEGDGLMVTKRTQIPEDIRRAVLIEAGYRCAVPTCRALLVLDLHHLVPVRDGGENAAGNLLALCPTCHAMHERGKIDQEAVRAWKAMLVSLCAAFDRTAIDSLLLLRDLKKNGHDTLAVSGDGVGRYASLIFSGLAEYRSKGGLRGGLNEDWFEVRASEKGLRLIEAWQSGNSDAVRAATASTLQSTSE